MEIVSFIKEEIENIKRLQQELRKFKNQSELRRVHGSILHDFYNGCERIFKIITKEINGIFEAGDHWHKQLLYQMTIELKGKRPYVISEELAADLIEYLQFRHLFRNIYGFELKSDLLERLVGKFERVSDRFISEIGQFLNKIER